MDETTLTPGPDDSGIDRGDSAETADEQAQPAERIARDGYGLDNVPQADSDLEDVTVLGSEDWASDAGPAQSNDVMSSPEE